MSASQRPPTGPETRGQEGAEQGGLAARGLLRAVRYYQRELSPRKPAPTCRFTPSCSEYAAQAIARHGALRGGWLAAWRVVRCNPLVPGGFDPVPEHFPRQYQQQANPDQATPPRLPVQDPSTPSRPEKNGPPAPGRRGRRKKA